MQLGRPQPAWQRLEVRVAATASLVRLLRQHGLHPVRVTVEDKAEIELDCAPGSLAMLLDRVLTEADCDDEGRICLPWRGATLICRVGPLWQTPPPASLATLRQGEPYDG